MVNPFPVKFCAVSSVEQTDAVKFDCLDARTLAVTHITANSAREADQILLRTFFWLAAPVTIWLLLLVIRKRRHAFARWAGRLRERAKTGWFGNPLIEEDSGLYLLDDDIWFH